MPSAGFEPTIPASERPQTDVLDRAATGIGNNNNNNYYYYYYVRRNIFTVVAEIV
jgi:hypothetical protein